VIGIMDYFIQMKPDKYFEVFFMRNNDTFNNISNIYVTFTLIKRNYFDYLCAIKSGI